MAVQREIHLPNRFTADGHHRSEHAGATSMAPTTEYLAVLKASFDYEPQSEDEIAIKEDQLLFLIERVDDE